jgi:hypothetical protein
MVNTCTMVITKGPNKKKLCRDVHRWCKHKSISCSTCHHSFRYQHTYDTHTCESSTRLKIKVKVKPALYDAASRNFSQSQSQSQIETLELKEMVSKLQNELEVIKNQPKVQINNLTVITDDIFGRMVTQMGQEDATRFLLDSLDNEAECLNIVDKVYLTASDKNQYPIACRNNNHFRFLGPNSKIVDDIGGDLIVSKLTNSVQNAFLKASANLIEGHVKGDQTESLYSMYDMRFVQDRIKQLPTADHKEKLREGLATKVTNPTHPFFQLEE